MIHLKVFEDDDDVQEVQEAQIAFANPGTKVLKDTALLVQKYLNRQAAPRHTCKDCFVCKSVHLDVCMYVCVCIYIYI
jgi:hypothetical protein